MVAQKVTKKQFIETIENNEDRKPNKELAADLDISEKRFYELLKRWRDDIRDAAVELTKKKAIKMVQCLERNAGEGDTQAAKTVLEMAGAYVQRQKVEQNVKLEGVVVLPAEVPTGTPINTKDNEGENKTLPDKP